MRTPQWRVTARAQITERAIEGPQIIIYDFGAGKLGTSKRPED